VKSAGAFSAAKTVDGKLYIRGMKDDGNWNDAEGEKWELNKYFSAKDGLIPSSLDKDKAQEKDKGSKIRSFSFELHRLIVILENGAVFAYG
jgi:hypothetical protein